MAKASTKFKRVVSGGTLVLAGAALLYAAVVSLLVYETTHSDIGVFGIAVVIVLPLLWVDVETLQGRGDVHSRLLVSGWALVLAVGLFVLSTDVLGSNGGASPLVAMTLWAAIFCLLGAAVIGGLATVALWEHEHE